MCSVSINIGTKFNRNTLGRILTKLWINELKQNMAADRKERLVFRRNGITGGPSTKWRTVLLWAPLVASPLPPHHSYSTQYYSRCAFSSGGVLDTIIKAARRVLQLALSLKQTTLKIVKLKSKYRRLLFYFFRDDIASKLWGWTYPTTKLVGFQM